MKRIARYFLFTIVLLAASLLVLGYCSWQWLNQPLNTFGNTPTKHSLTIEKGQTLSQVASVLKAQSVVAYPKLWLAYARHKNIAKKIQAGKYSISGAQTPVELLDQLVRGGVDFRKLTIIEGSRYADVLKKFNSSTYIEPDANNLSQQQLVAALGFDRGTVLEGWFYPDTLVFAEGTSALTLLKQGKDRMLAVLNEEWAKREKNLPYESAYEALIMASIVEKETGRASERAQIAGVFVRRLRKGMRLQTDPTVIYGMGDRYKGNIRHSDLRADTAYNTYTRRGLPPSPIALPGRDAIHAALHPAKGDALFFVAKGDGSHHFSVTLAEHEKAVTQYQRSRRSDYRSSP